MLTKVFFIFNMRDLFLGIKEFRKASGSRSSFSRQKNWMVWSWEATGAGHNTPRKMSTTRNGGPRKVGTNINV